MSDARAKTGRNYACPCGSNKKFKKCCGSVANASVGVPVEKPRPPVRTSPELLTLGYRILDILEIVATSIVPNPTDVPLRLRQVCAYHFAAKIHGATLAAMALLDRGYAREAFPYERHIYEYFISASYYERFPDEAERFIASMPVIFKRMRDKWVSLDPAAPVAQLDLDAAAADAQVRFPTLQRPKGKSGASKTPVLVDWAPPEPLNMSILVNKYDMTKNPRVAEMARSRFQMPATASIDEIAERFARARHFEVSEHSSQFIHGTVFALGTMLEPGVSQRFSRFSMEFEEENELLCGFLNFCLGVASLVGRVSSVDVGAMLDPLRKEFDAMRSRYVSG